MLFIRRRAVRARVCILSLPARNISQAAEIAAVRQEAITDRSWGTTPEAKAVLASTLQRINEASLPASTATAWSPAGAEPEEDANMHAYLSRRVQPPSSLNASAHRTLSATLTFPLTLSYGLRRVFSSHEEKKEKVRVLCLGARAESSLPRVWWDQCLASSAGVVGKSLSIGFLGPHLQTHRPPRPAPALRGGGGSGRSSGRSLDIHHVEGGAGLFHEHPEWQRLLLHTDVFVLFNPGLGATQALTDSWAPTLRLLFMSRKPVLATAHSAHDLQRDLACLERLTAEEDEQDIGEPMVRIFAPHRNPFASSRRTCDDKEAPEAQVVTTNEFIYAFAAK